MEKDHNMSVKIYKHAGAYVLIVSVFIIFKLIELRLEKDTPKVGELVSSNSNEKKPSE